MKKNIGLFALLITLAMIKTNAVAMTKTDTAAIVAEKKKLYAAVVSGKAEDLITSRAAFEAMLTTDSRKDLIHYYIAYADYQLVSIFNAKNKTAQSETYLEDGITQLESAKALNEKSAEVLALLGSLYGMKAGTGMINGMRFGSKSSGAFEAALALAPTNPRAVMLDGISKFYTPSMFGGDKVAAAVQFKKAADLFESASKTSGEKTETIEPDWGHAESYIWQGVAAMDKNDNAAAKTALDKALQIAPDYAWVKYNLYPKLSAK
jgi:tetratricopeptide (TPR) repeat protein